MIRTLFLLAYGSLLLSLAFRRLRQNRLKERYVLIFAIVGLPFLLLAVWPDGIVFVSELLAIEKATLLVLSLAAFVLLMLFELLTIVSVQDQKITALAQEIALLNNQAASNPQGDEDSAT